MKVIIIAVPHLVMQGPRLMEMLPSLCRDFQSFSTRHPMGERGRLQRKFRWNRLDVASVSSISWAKTFHGYSEENGGLENTQICAQAWRKMGSVSNRPASTATAQSNENPKHYWFLLSARHSVISSGQLVTIISIQSHDRLWDHYYFLWMQRLKDVRGNQVTYSRSYR